MISNIEINEETGEHVVYGCYTSWSPPPQGGCLNSRKVRLIISNDKTVRKKSQINAVKLSTTEQRFLQVPKTP